MHFETLQPEHLPLLHDWLRRDYARFWAMGHLSLAQLADYVGEIQRSSHRDIAIGMCNGEPAFLFEGYHPAHDLLADHYQVRPGDRGMHLLLAPCEKPVHGFSLEVMRSILAYQFADPFARRIVVEPDARNAKVHALNQRVGFVYQRLLQLPEKDACLAFCTRAQFLATLQENPQ
jgi:RimJ/RimL family protein N-acetyltransferase